MGRTGESQNNQANQQMANIQQAEFNQNQALTKQYESDLSSLKAQGNPYEAPAYKQTERLGAAEAAGAANKSGVEAVNNEVGQTGTNAASMPYYRAMMAKNAARAQGANLVAQNASDTKNATDYQQWLLGAELAPTGVDTQMFGDATSGRSAALNNLTQLGLASYGTVNSLIGAAGAAGAAGFGAACPAEGSLYLLGDNSVLAVELLTVGDKIMGIDDESQTIEEIQSEMAETVHVTTENGHQARNSYTHAYALPKGGFVVAARALGKTIVTATGPSKVVSVEPAGVAKVFNVITDGSHTYCADGIWALGVGEAERHVSMAAWGKIGLNLMHEVCEVR